MDIMTFGHLFALLVGMCGALFKNAKKWFPLSLLIGWLGGFLGDRIFELFYEGGVNISLSRLGYIDILAVLTGFAVMRALVYSYYKHSPHVRHYAAHDILTPSQWKLSALVMICIAIGLIFYQQHLETVRRTRQSNEVWGPDCYPPMVVERGLECCSPMACAPASEK